ncbi:centromere protein W isoform 1-T1 [Hipposideros larvatus]
MALSTTVSQKKQIRRKAPRGFLRRIFKRQKPHLRLETSGDLLVHLNCLLFVHRLAEESRTNACENKCGVIKNEHVLAAAKVSFENWTSVEHVMLTYCQ